MAAAAGVSLATASRVLGGSSRTVAPEYEQRVLAAATALRYTADVSARAMRRVSDAIALVADDLTTPSMGMVVAAMEREARAAGAFVTVSSTRGTPERQLETVRLLRALRPRALVLTTGRIEADVLHGHLVKELRAYESQGGRVVIVGDTDTDFDSIRFDNHSAAYDMGRYVAEAGHRQVAVLAGPSGQAAVSARASGFSEGLQSGGVDSRRIRIVNCLLSRQGGFDAVLKLLDAGLGELDSVLAANDLLAIGAMSGLRSAGVVVPEQISITGFDDIQLAVDVTPRLTTVALPLAHAGTEAIRLAIKARTQATKLTLHGRVVVRDSTVNRAAPSA